MKKEFVSSSTKFYVVVNSLPYLAQEAKLKFSAKKSSVLKYGHALNNKGSNKFGFMLKLISLASNPNVLQTKGESDIFSVFTLHLHHYSLLMQFNHSDR